MHPLNALISTNEMLSGIRIDSSEEQPLNAYIPIFDKSGASIKSTDRILELFSNAKFATLIIFELS